MKHIISVLLVFLCFFAKAQQTEYVDFKTAKVDLNVINFENQEISGKAIFEIDILKNIDSIYLNINSKSVDAIYNNGRLLKDYMNDGKHIIIKDTFKANTNKEIVINWTTSPKKALYFVEKENSNQIWTQGQGKYTSNWLPSIDDMNDKIEFDLSITYPNGYEVIANGKLINKDIDEETTKWHYDMQNPISSYLVALAVGKYKKKTEISNSGIPLEMYYYPEDSAKFEPTYRYTKRMFDFLETEIGVPYPWQNYKQVPVRDFLYSGMENTSLTIFSDDFMIDDTSFIDKNYVNVNAHELAHQWFGDLVTETSGTHHWLHEGFATYYALLAERDIFGDDYYYWKLYEYAQELLEQDKAGESTSLLDPKSSSVTFYKKGAWVLHLLREKVGDDAFKKAVKIYLEKHAFKNVETNDFISEVERTSGQDLSQFVKLFIIASDNTRIGGVASGIKHDLFEKSGIKFLKCRVGEDLNKFHKKQNNQKTEALSKNINELTKSEIFKDLIKDSLVDKTELYTKAFQSKSLKTRQNIASNLTQIPQEFKENYESLLQDKSYVTIERALYNLWANFPDNRNVYLNLTKSIYSFNDYNVRTLWLTLAIATPNYDEEHKSDYYNELINYTTKTNPFQLRQNAFVYLNELNLYNDIALENIVEASQHHNWRFKSFARDMIVTLSEQEKYKQKLKTLQVKQK